MMEFPEKYEVGPYDRYKVGRNNTTYKGEITSGNPLTGRGPPCRLIIAETKALI